MVRGVPIVKKVREIIISMYCKGLSIQKIATELNLSKSSVGNVTKYYADRGTLEIKGKSPGRPSVVKPRDQRKLVKICKGGRRSTLREITACWNNETNLNLSRECCRRWIHHSGLSFYKVSTKYDTCTAKLGTSLIIYMVLGKRKTFINCGTEEASLNMGKVESDMDL